MKFKNLVIIEYIISAVLLIEGIALNDWSLNHNQIKILMWLFAFNIFTIILWFIDVFLTRRAREGVNNES